MFCQSCHIHFFPCTSGLITWEHLLTCILWSITTYGCASSMTPNHRPYTVRRFCGTAGAWQYVYTTAVDEKVNLLSTQRECMSALQTASIPRWEHRSTIVVSLTSICLDINSTQTRRIFQHNFHTWIGKRQSYRYSEESIQHSTIPFLCALLQCS